MYYWIRLYEYKIREKAISNLSKCIINALIINRSDSQENCLGRYINNLDGLI